MNEYVDFAVNIGKKIISANCDSELKKDSNKDSAKPGLVRRAVDFPSLMLTLGFSPAYIFYVSKAEKIEDIYEFYKVLKGESNNNRVVCDELQKKESAGYSGYVGIILFALERLGKSITITPDKNNLYYNLIDIASKVDFKDERRLILYLNEVKKVMEALPYG